MVDETLSDLEIANEKYNQMSSDLDAKSAELEKLRIFKFMVRHAETREETLLSKVNHLLCFISLLTLFFS